MARHTNTRIAKCTILGKIFRDTGSFDAKTENALFLTTPDNKDSELRTELVLEPDMSRKGRDILEVFYIFLTILSFALTTVVTLLLWLTLRWTFSWTLIR